jgi:predicted ArsR family transcriptional regulator
MVHEDDFGRAAQMLDGSTRHEVLRVLVRRGEANVTQISAESHVQAAAVNRHINALEDLGVVDVDVPRGARQGRGVTATLNRALYTEWLECWIAAMTKGA